MLSDIQYDKIRAAFKRGTLLVQSVSSDSGGAEWKPVVAVHRAEVGPESIWEAQTEDGPMILTGGHRVFLTPWVKNEMEALRVGGGVMVIRDGWDRPGVGPILTHKRLPDRKYMYDLTAADWHNFLLHRSKVIISNSPDRNYHFRPPEHEADIGDYNRVFGYVWEDAELKVYLERGLDWWDMFPPSTYIGTIDKLCNETPSWRTAIYYGGMQFALMALAINWVHEEFSVVGDTKVKVYLPDGREVDIPIEELHSICSEEG